jgi:hypothetical protein
MWGAWKRARRWWKCLFWHYRPGPSQRREYHEHSNKDSKGETASEAKVDVDEVESGRMQVGDDMVDAVGLVQH